MARHETYTFGGFTLEVPERRLSDGSGPIAIAPKAFDVLVALVRHAGTLVGKKELLEMVWPDSFVEEGILTVHVSALRKALGDSSRPPAVIQTVARAGYRFIAAVSGERSDARAIPGRWSIAVLPARPLSGGTDGEQLVGLAITDALIDGLGRFDPVVVRPMTAVHTYRSAIEDPAAIGRRLRTDVVLDPTFERTPSGIRLSARLVRCGDGSRLWQGDFADSADRTAASTVADAVASELGAFPHVQTDRDPGPDRPPGRRSRIEVYELCGRGRSHLLSASMVEVPKAIEAFRAAVELDPSYAPAHAGLAQAYCAQAAMRVAPPFDAYRDARAAALRALAVDDGSADAQLALGSVLFLAEWDWHGAERCLQRAIEINPNHVEAHLMYGRLLEALGRTEDALDLKLRAFERDPFSPLVHVQIAHCCWNLRRYDDAIEWANKALALDPRHPIAREFLASASLFKGDFDRYIVEVVAHAAALGAPVDCVAPLEAAYAEGGRSGFWRVSLEQMSRNPRVPAYQFAVFLAQAGDVDGAFHHLDRAIVEHDPSLVDLAVAPQWDSLRADPRFDACVSRMGLHGAAAAGTPPVQSRAEA